MYSQTSRSMAAILVVVFSILGPLCIRQQNALAQSLDIATTHPENPGTASTEPEELDTSPLLVVDGVLETGDPTFSSDGRLYDAHTFEGRAGQTVSIVMESLVFDAHLQVQSPNHHPIASNDDYQKSTWNAALVLTLPEDGTYTVLTNAVGAYGRGRYRVTVIPIMSDQSVPVFSDTALLQSDAYHLNQQGIRYVDVSDYQKALMVLEQALDIYESINDRFGQGSLLNNLAIVHSSLGDYQQALSLLQTSLVIRQEIGDRPGEGTTLNNIGLQHDNLSEYGSALSFYQQSLAIRREIGDRFGEATTLHNIGAVYRSLGEPNNALSFYQQSLVIRQKIGDRFGEGANLHNIGRTYSDLGDYDSALTYYQQSVAIRQEIGDRFGEGQTLTSMGALYNQLGQYELALATLQSSLTITQEIGDRAGEGIALNNMGLVHQSLGNYQQALSNYQSSVAIRQAIGDRAGAATTFRNIGLVFEELKEAELAILFLKQSVNIREEIRDDIKVLSQEQQQSFTDTIADDYRELADLLLQQDRVLEAQRVLDLLKVQELDDYLRGVRSTDSTTSGIVLRPDEAELYDLYQANQNELIALGNQRAELAQISVDSRTPEQKTRLVELRRLEAAVRQTFAHFLDTDAVKAIVAKLRQTTGAANLELAELSALRDNLKALNQTNQNAVVLYPLVLEDRLELVLVTANQEPIRRTSTVSRTDLNRAIATFRSALESPDSDAITPAQHLYDLLIRPIAVDLAQANADTILYAPDGQLRYIPLAALHDGDQWLEETMQVNNIVAASLSDLMPTTDPNGATAPKPLSVLAAAFTEGTHNVTINDGRGDRTFSFGGLTFAGPEVETLASLIPQTAKRLNQDFNADILFEMDDYGIVHLATHAAFNPGPPENSFILFGDGSHATLTDVRNTWSFPNVSLVVLSACETAVGDVRLGDSDGGNGKEANGEEILGFGYLMQLAGAEAAIASLWQVSDGGTQTLMDAFYTALNNGHTKAEALRRTQVALIRNDGSVLARGDRGIVMESTDSETPLNVFTQDLEGLLSHPYYWAPFILIGNGL